MKSKHVTLVAATAQTVTLTGDTFQQLLIINVDGGATAPVYFTHATNGATPVTAVGAADDTMVASAGAPAIPVDVGNSNEVQVSLISSGTPTVAVIAG